MTLAATIDHKVLGGNFFRERKERVRFRSDPPPPPRTPTRRPARVASMLAMAHHLLDAIDQGTVADRASVGRRLGLSRARITQLLDLTLLAPDIQQRILDLEAVDGREPLCERVLRRVVHAGSWPLQRAVWGGLKVNGTPDAPRASEAAPAPAA